MKISNRLAVGFFSILFVGIPGVLVSIYTHSLTHREFETLAEDIIPNTVMVGDMEQAALASHVHLMEYLLYGQAEEEALALSRLDDLRRLGRQHVEHEARFGAKHEREARKLVTQIRACALAAGEMIDLKKHSPTLAEMLTKEEETFHPVKKALIETLSEYRAAHGEELVEAKEAVRKAYTAAIRITLGAAICAILAVIIAAVIVSRSIINPIRLLQKGTKAVAAGDLEHRIGATSNDEFGQLGRSFDRMTEKLSDSLVSKIILEESNRALASEVKTRKRTQEALQESEEGLRITLASIGDGVIATDVRRRVTRLNAEAEAMTGWKSDDATGQPLGEVFNIVNEETGEPAEDPVAKVLASGRIEGLANHTVLISKDGSRRAIADSAAPIRVADGQVVGVVLVFRDVSEERKHEQEKEELFHQLGERVKELQCMYSAAQSIRDREDLADSFQDVASLIPPGWHYPEITRGRVIFDGAEYVSEPFQPTQWKQSSDIVVDGESRGAVEVYYLEERPELDEGPFMAEERELIDGLARALSEGVERKRAEAGLELARIDAEQANEAKSEFLANMSHEIRTPVTAVLGFADLLADPALSASDRDNYLAVVRRNGEHLLDLINDILDLSKIEAGKLNIERRPCSAVSVAADVASMMRARAQQQGITLSMEYTGEMPETILTDGFRLRQALVNLVGNAVKFTEEGSVRIVGAFLPSWRRSRPAVKFDIIDTGVGIAADKLEHLFQPFVQADTSTSRRYGGTGLGLAITRHIAMLLGGEVTAESAAGEGSTFTLIIPTGSLEGVRMLDRPAEIVCSAAGGAEQIVGGADALSGVSILLAEDGRDNQVLMTTVLRKAGAKVEVAENGRIAVERFADDTSAFDLVLMDMQMPEMDGYEATATLRRNGVGVPIVALTAHAMTGDKEKCLSAGCSDYCSKPVSRAQLIGTVARHTGRAPTATDATIHGARPIRSEYADDADLADIISEFVSRLPGRVTAMRETLANRHHEELQRLAHHLKGAGGSYGFPPLTDAARRVEDAAKIGDDEAATLALAELATLCKAIVAGQGAPARSNDERGNS